MTNRLRLFSALLTTLLALGAAEQACAQDTTNTANLVRTPEGRTAQLVLRDGSTLNVFPTALGRIGAAICWENYMPMLRMSYYAQGIQLYCAPTVDDRDTWLPTMRHIALEGRCFVLSSCQFARRGDFPPDYAPIQGDDPATVLIRGGSCIIGPLGEVLAGPVFNAPAILTADLDLDAIARGKYDLDVVGHYARPDIFQLQVNTQPQMAVSMKAGVGN